MATKKEETTAEVTVEKTNKNAKIYPWYEPIDKQHTDPVWVCINGKSVMIQRGEEVMVDEATYKVLQNRRRMMRESLERSQALAKSSRF